METSQPVEKGVCTEQEQAPAWRRRPAQYTPRLSTVSWLAFTLACVAVAVTLDRHGHKYCEKNYWKRECRLKRGSKKHYRQFLAEAGLMMPPVIHASVSADQLGNGRLLVVGDVHGCRDELQMLLAKINYTDSDNIILAGDLVDKGPYSIETIVEVRRLGALSVRGNHDDSGLAAYEALQRGEKVRNKHKWAHRLSAGDAQWLALLPWSLSVPAYNLLVVHAGIVPEVNLEDQLLVDLYRMREVAPGDDTKWHGLEAKTRGEGLPWAQVWQGPQHIVFGHDHQRGLQDERYATGIDTGVYTGAYLTGVLFPPVAEIETLRTEWKNASGGVTLQMLGAEIVQVKAKRKYDVHCAESDETEIY